MRSGVASGVRYTGMLKGDAATQFDSNSAVNDIGLSVRILPDPENSIGPVEPRRCEQQPLAGLLSFDSFLSWPLDRPACSRHGKRRQGYFANSIRPAVRCSACSTRACRSSPVSRGQQSIRRANWGSASPASGRKCCAFCCAPFDAVSTCFSNSLASCSLGR